MEEFIGEIWHRFITKASEKRHAAVAVELDEIIKTAAIFFRALGGDPGLNISASPATRHGARRRLLQKVAGSGDRIELSWMDGEVLRLPSLIDLFPTKELNRDLYLWLVAVSAVKVESGQSWIVGNQNATKATLLRFPGLAKRYENLVQAALDIRISPAQLPADESTQELTIRQALLFPGSVQVLPKSKLPFQPVPLWPHPSPPISSYSQFSEGGDSPEPQGKSQAQKSRRKHLAERTDAPEEKNGFLMMFRAESIFSWAEFVKVNRSQDDEDDSEAGHLAAEDMDTLSITRNGESTAASVKFDLDLPAGTDDMAVLGEGVLLPEWDWKKQVLQPSYCCLQEMLTVTEIDCDLPSALQRTAKLLRQQFQSLAPSKHWLRGQPDGGEADLDAWVQLNADKASGLMAEDSGLYRTQVNKQRDLACLLLADLSLSTDSYISNELRAIDVIKDSLLLFSEALTATGDRFALYGFSSLRRSQIHFRQIKGFDDKYDGKIRGRIASIKPGYYTRMGAAIRHASALLDQQKSQQRLLLILTDGKPNDMDQYEGRYGIEDTRVALNEARKLGLRPFCVTIDSEASDYLPHLFGVGGYIVIRKPEELPRELPLLYAQMTR